MTPDKGAPPPFDTSAQLRQLRERYRAGVPELVRTFRTLARQLATDAPAALDALRQTAHRVRGTAGSYGFHQASDVAGVLEERVIQWQADPALGRETRDAVVAQLVDALEVAFRAE